MQEGTITAGLTAPRQKPIAIQSNQGISKITLEKHAAVNASASYGQRVNRTTVIPFPLNVSSSPPIIRITQRQT